MSKARDLAAYMSANGILADGVISASEITGLNITQISQGDTVLSIDDSGTGGKVLIKVDNGIVGNINGNGIVIPTGTTAERNGSPALGELRYNTDINKFEGYSSGGWYTITNPPVLTSVTPASFDGTSGSSFTIAGGFLETGSTVKIIGNDGTQYTPASVTYTSVTSLSFTTPSNLPVSNEPYSITVTNPGGLSATLSDAIDAGSVPAFQTASGTLITTSQWNASASATVSATDAEDGAISNYSIVSGSLPSGFTLNSSTGAISGTGNAAVATTTYTFTIQATDSAGNTATRAFSIVITNAVPSFAGQTSSFSFAEAQSATITLAATDPESQAITYTLQSGSLPSGMSLSGNTISGTPNTPGTSNFTIAATDAQGGVGTLAHTVTINQAPRLFQSAGSSNTYTATAGQVYEFIVIGGGGHGGGQGGGGGGGGAAYFRGKYTPSTNTTFTAIIGYGAQVNSDGNTTQNSSDTVLTISGVMTVRAGRGENALSNRSGGTRGQVTLTGSGITTVTSREGGDGGDGSSNYGTGGGGAAGGGQGGDTVTGTYGQGGRRGQNYLGQLVGGQAGGTTSRSSWDGSSGGGAADLQGAGGGGGGAGTVGSSNGATGGPGGPGLTINNVTLSATSGGSGGSNGSGSAGFGGNYGGGGGGGRSTYGPPAGGGVGVVFIWPSS